MSAAVATAAAVGVGAVAGAALLASPAWAAEGLKVTIGSPVLQGKVGDKVNLEFGVTNVSDKVTVQAIMITVQAPGNAVIEQAPDSCELRGGGRTVVCTEKGDLGPHKTAKGQVTITIKSAGNGGGRVSARDATHQDNADFQIRATGPTPSASGKKPTPTKSADVSQEPSLTDETLAPPQAGNGVVVQSDEPVPSKSSGNSGGLSAGFWIGIGAVVAALGLVGSLFYFRRRDKLEPDTGMHPVVPAPDGFPGYRPPPPAPTTYGTPATYGAPPAGGPTQVVDPGFGTAPGGPTQIINPNAGGMPPAGGGDQTVMFRRPEDF
ncbi:hypothetical protein GCM10010170_044280 [Dactylosporangium salmoneum]|uniref:DUF11 domain-containing protein n=1 Tax=Dactylosporangium salmoneum TaxID=53361 RepID=A0ABN3GL90_9ACTN